MNYSSREHEKTPTQTLTQRLTVPHWRLLRPKRTSTRNSSGDEIPERDIALFCYPCCV